MKPLRLRNPDHRADRSARDAPKRTYWGNVISIFKFIGKAFDVARTSVVNIVVVGSAILLGIAAWNSLQNNSILIRLPAMPKPLTDSGWTPEVFSRSISQHIDEIQDTAKSKIDRDDFQLGNEQIELVVPVEKISLTYIVDQIRRTLNMPQRTLFIEVVELDDRHLRAECPRIIPKDGGTHYMFRAYLKPGGIVWQECRSTLTTLAKAGAETTILKTKPYLLASYYWAREDRQRAAFYAQKIIRNGPDDERKYALNLLGIMLKSGKRCIDATKKFKEAIAKDENFASAHVNLAEALYLRNLLDRALVEANKGVRLDPKMFYAYYIQGSVLAAKGRHKEAIASFRTAIKYKKDRAYVHNKLGTSLAAIGETKLAEESFRKAIKIQSNYWPAHDGLGKVLASSKREKEAEEHFRTASEIRKKYNVKITPEAGRAQEPQCVRLF